MIRPKLSVINAAIFASLLLFFFQNCQFKKLSSTRDLASALDPAAFAVGEETAPLAEIISAPDAAEELAGIALSPNEAVLNWVLPAQSVSRINIERSLEPSGPFVSIAVINQAASTFTDTGLTPSTTYYYRIILENADGISAYSLVASVATAASVALPPPVIEPLPEQIPPADGTSPPQEETSVPEPVVSEPPSSSSPPVYSEPPASSPPPSSGSDSDGGSQPKTDSDSDYLRLKDPYL